MKGVQLDSWHEIDLSGPLEGVLYEKVGGIATITLNRPERGNAMHPGMMPALREASPAAKSEPP